MVNKELIKNTMDLIKAQPETHDQGNWVCQDTNSPCGTTMCFAGHAAVLAGAEIPDPKKHRIVDWFVGPGGEYLNSDDYYNLNKPGVPVASYARQAMGVEYHESSYMFESDRPVEDLEMAVQELLVHGKILTFNEIEEGDPYDECDCCENDCD